jgi:hypothetical protein
VHNTLKVDWLLLIVTFVKKNTSKISWHYHLTFSGSILFKAFPDKMKLLVSDPVLSRKLKMVIAFCEQLGSGLSALLLTFTK